MNEQEARDFIRNEVNILVWKKVCMALVFVGVVNLACLVWLFHNVENTAQAVAIIQVRKVAQNYADDKLSKFSGFADIAQSRIRDIDKDFLGLYTQLGEAKERFAQIEDTRRKSADALSQLNGDFGKLKADVNAFRQESTATMDALSAKLGSLNSRNASWNGIRDRSQGLNLDGGNDATIPGKLYFTAESAYDYLTPFTPGGLTWYHNSASESKTGQFLIADTADWDNQVYIFTLGPGNPSGIGYGNANKYLAIQQEGGRPGTLNAASIILQSTKTPGSPLDGQIYYNGTHWYGWNAGNSKWKQLDN